MASEREWGCYPQVRGLAICQLARQDGVDAVLVAPWRWDGRERRPAGRAAAWPIPRPSCTACSTASRPRAWCGGHGTDWKPAMTPWAPELAAVMRHRNVRIEEELTLDTLLQDLSP